MTKIFGCLLILYLFAVGVSAQFHGGCECGVLQVLGPADIAAPGEPLIFKANVSGGNQKNYTFVWSIDKGSIVSGYGTRTITVDTTGLNGETVTASVEIKGEDCPVCDLSGSEVGVVGSAPEPIPFDEFGPVTREDLNSRLHAFYAMLQSDPNATGYLVSYGTARIRARYENYVRQEIERVRFDPTRLVFVNGGSREEPLFKFWLAPAGAGPPEID